MQGFCDLEEEKFIPSGESHRIRFSGTPLGTVALKASFLYLKRLVFFFQPKPQLMAFIFYHLQFFLHLIGDKYHYLLHLFGDNYLNK